MAASSLYYAHMDSTPGKITHSPKIVRLCSTPVSAIYNPENVQLNIMHNPVTHLHRMHNIQCILNDGVVPNREIEYGITILCKNVMSYDLFPYIYPTFVT